MIKSQTVLDGHLFFRSAHPVIDRLTPNVLFAPPTPIPAPAPLMPDAKLNGAGLLSVFSMPLLYVERPVLEPGWPRNEDIVVLYLATGSEITISERALWLSLLFESKFSLVGELEKQVYGLLLVRCSVSAELSLKIGRGRFVVETAFGMQALPRRCEESSVGMLDCVVFVIFVVLEG